MPSRLRESRAARKRAITPSMASIEDEGRFIPTDEQIVKWLRGLEGYETDDGVHDADLAKDVGRVRELHEQAQFLRDHIHRLEMAQHRQDTKKRILFMGRNPNSEDLAHPFVVGLHWFDDKPPLLQPCTEAVFFEVLATIIKDHKPEVVVAPA